MAKRARIIVKILAGDLECFHQTSAFRVVKRRVREPRITKGRVLSLIDGPGGINRRHSVSAIFIDQKDRILHGLSRDDARDQIGGFTFVGLSEHGVAIVNVNQVARKIFIADRAKGAMTSGGTG
jgi:hypothetical protein